MHRAADRWHDHANVNVVDLPERLIKEFGVAIVPGAAFGDDRWVRLSYAASDRDIDSALDRIIRFVVKLGG